MVTVVNYDLNYDKAKLCKANLGTDVDSHKEVIDEFIKLYFVFMESNEGLIKFRNSDTDLWWKYANENVYGKTHQLKISHNNSEIILRGDTIGTYKILKNRFQNKSSCLEKLDYNLTMGSMLMIPYMDKEHSINLTRSRQPYNDNFFYFLKCLQEYYDDCEKQNFELTSCFIATSNFWKMFKTYKDFSSLSALEMFDESLKSNPRLALSVNEWQVEDFNKYFDTLNKCIEERNLVLKKRLESQITR